MVEVFESGFRWVEIKDDNGKEIWSLRSPLGRAAATVFKRPSCGKHVWFVWDMDGVGGENSSEPTIEQAKIVAESAVLRWGKHFRTRQRKE